MSETQTQTADPQDEKGRSVENAIFTKDFMSTKDAMKFGVNNDPGVTVWLGSIIGTVLSGQEKRTTRPDGTVLRSYQFNGVIEAVRYSDGVTKTGRSVFLPGAFSDELEMVLERIKSDGGTNVSFAIEIGLEATGRTIPYAWKVKAYGKRDVDLLAEIRKNLPPGLKFRVQKAIEADNREDIPMPTSAFAEGEKAGIVTDGEADKPAKASKGAK